MTPLSDGEMRADDNPDKCVSPWDCEYSATKLTETYDCNVGISW